MSTKEEMAKAQAFDLLYRLIGIMNAVPAIGAWLPHERERLTAIHNDLARASDGLRGIFDDLSRQRWPEIHDEGER